MISDDDFFMQNADYHYGASDAEKMYGRGYDDYNYNSRASGLLLRPPTLEEKIRRDANKERLGLGLFIVGGGGSIAFIIFILLMSICPYEFSGYLFFGFIISLIILFVFYIYMYLDDKHRVDRMIDEMNAEHHSKDSDVNSNRTVGRNDKLFEGQDREYFEQHNRVYKKPKKEFVICPHCGKYLNPNAIDIHKKCTHCGKYLNPNALNIQKKVYDVSYNSKNHTSKSSGDYMEFVL